MTPLSHLGLALGAEGGSRQSKRQAMDTSASTLLRLLRRMRLPDMPTPRVLGVDDFAWRKGRSYGTLLVDGETHRPVDVLPDRTAETLAAWLRQHPGVDIITRDRSTEYARGVSLGAPHAVQVADRWHLLVNLQEALERMLSRLRSPLLNQTFPTNEWMEVPMAMTMYDRARRRGTKDQAEQQASRARRYERYAQVKTLQAKGHNILQITKALNLSRQTVRKYMASAAFPDYPPTKRQPSILDPYVSYLQQRWDAGCHDSRQLWREIRDRGYPGSTRMVWLWVALRRQRLSKGRTPARQVEVFTPDASSTMRAANTLLPTSYQLAWLLVRPLTDLDDNQQRLRQYLCQFPDIDHAAHLVQQFASLLRSHLVTTLA